MNLGDLTQRPTEPGEFADDHAVAALEDAHQLVEPPALFGTNLVGTPRSADPPVRRLRTLAGRILASARWMLPAFGHVASGSEMHATQREAVANVERRRREREASSARDLTMQEWARQVLLGTLTAAEGEGD